MAFVARQNQTVYDGTDNDESYHLKVLRLVIKTILDAADAEKTAHSRGSAYWYLDTSRINGGDEPSAVGASDNAIYEMSTDSGYKSYGVFFKNGANETAFLCFSNYASYDVDSQKASVGLSVNPVIGSNNVYSDNGQVYDFSINSISSYGLGLAVSKNDFGGYNYPWQSGFWADGDLKILTDLYYNNEPSSVYTSGEYTNVIVAIDGKRIIIDRRSSYYGKVDCVLLYGDIISPYSNSDTQIDCIFAMGQWMTGGGFNHYTAMFRDKSGSTTFNPNGSNFADMRKPYALVNTAMIDGSNSNSIPYTGISFGWQNCAKSSPNTTLNDNGIGYKGITNPLYVRVITASGIVQNKAIYDDNGSDLFVIAQYITDNESFSIAVPWDSSNPEINS